LILLNGIFTTVPFPDKFHSTYPDRQEVFEEVL